jgi:CHAD domain-containing protein
MAYKLRLKEPLEDGVRRIAVEQLDRLLAMPRAGDERVAWVHETRKATKRLRALLRLVRSGLAPADWRRENDALRAIARLLSPMRDRDVLGQTIALLGDGGDKQLRGALARLAARLERDHPRPPARDGPNDAGETTIAEAVGLLEAARHRLVRLDVAGNVVDVVGAGLEQAQRRARKTLRRAEADPGDANHHDLRKALQTCWRQALLIEASWPEIQSTRAAVARSLSQALGEVQDLAVLARTVSGPTAANGQRRDGDRIALACRRRQEQLRVAAFPAAGRLLALPPKALAAELAGSWPRSMALAAGEARQRKDAGAKPAAAAAPRKKTPARLRSRA